MLLHKSSILYQIQKLIILNFCFRIKNKKENIKIKLFFKLMDPFYVLNRITISNISLLRIFKNNKHVLFWKILIVIYLHLKIKKPNKF